MWYFTIRISQLTILATTLVSTAVYAQHFKVSGTVKDRITKELIIGATVRIPNSTYTSITNSEGKFFFSGDKTKKALIVVSALNYKAKATEISASAPEEINLDIELDQKETLLQEVRVEGANFHRPIESPISIKNLSSSEIERMPGGLRDVSRVLQAFPGLAVAPAYRNDLLVRGGGSYENKFYLDGIPIPCINHFTTQGSSGGIYGIINPNYLKDVDFYSGALPNNKGNALSSIIELKLKEGSPEKNKLGVVLGPTDLSLISDGPLANKVTYLASVRLSSWHTTAKTLGLIVSPEYYDYLLKLTYKIAPKSELSFVSIGTKDYAEPNLDASRGLFLNQNDADMIASSKAYLRQININNQNTYTAGLTFKQYIGKSIISTSISGYHLYNALTNFTDQANPSEGNKSLDYSSTEFQNSLRIKYVYQSARGTNIEAGLTIENSGIQLNNFNLYPNGALIDTIHYTTDFTMSQYSAFVQVSPSIKKLNLSFGLRTDINNFNTFVSKFYHQLSPQLSASYPLTAKVHLNLTMGLYHQAPLTTLLSFKNNEGQFTNLDSLKYMQCFHKVIGLDYQTDKNLKIAVEFFHKTYSNIPYLTDQRVVLPNAISFVSQQSVGLSQANSSGSGRSYGLEVLLHQKLWKSYYGILAYTLMKSEYSDNQGVYRPSGWDNRHTVSITGGKLFSKQWEIGAKLRFSSGSPYTPIDYTISATKAVFDLNPLGVLDVSNLNNARFPIYHALDIRVEKRYSYKRIAISVFFDAQNVYNTAPQMPPFLSQLVDGQGKALTSPEDPTKYLVRKTSFKAPFNVLPTCGLVVTIK
jgi:hypothetical protein